MEDPQLIYLLSDATGETAEKILNAALIQFRDKAVKVYRLSHVRDKNSIFKHLDEALKSRALVVYTMVNRELAQLVHDECEALGVPHLDLITPLLMKVSEFFGRSPKQTPGLLHDMDEDYFRRIEAVEFTVKHDDGQELRHLPYADIVLAGVSRTSKTPLSTYLAHRGWKVANVPLIKGIEPPAELMQVDPKRVAGLYIDPQRLAELRAAYADLEEIEDELRFAKAFFRRNGWIMVDVSGKALEETANEVLVKLKLK